MKQHVRSNEKNGPQLWAVGGGKGGIGKSFISSSLAITLSKMGFTVTLIDLDLGSANLHTCLGIPAPSQSLSDFTSGRVSDLSTLSVSTSVAGLSFVSGFNDSLNIADLGVDGRRKLLDAVRMLKTEFVILDLGAGTAENTLDFFLAAHRKIVAVTPEPTSVENAYRFLKSGFYRQLKLAESELGLTSLIDEAMDSRNQLGIRSPSDLVNYITRVDPKVGGRLRQQIESFNISIIVNQVRTQVDRDLGPSMVSVCRKYFGIESSYLGHLDHDNAVWQTLRKKRPIVLEHPYSNIVGQFTNITKSLVGVAPLRAVI